MHCKYGDSSGDISDSEEKSDSCDVSLKESHDGFLVREIDVGFLILFWSFCVSSCISDFKTLYFALYSCILHSILCSILHSILRSIQRSILRSILCSILDARGASLVFFNTFAASSWG